MLNLRVKLTKKKSCLFKPIYILSLNPFLFRFSWLNENNIYPLHTSSGVISSVEENSSPYILWHFTKTQKDDVVRYLHVSFLPYKGEAVLNPWELRPVKLDNSTCFMFFCIYFVRSKSIGENFPFIISVILLWAPWLIQICVGCRALLYPPTQSILI